MQRLRFFILAFFIAVSTPLAYVIWRTYAGLAQEERGQLQFFSETLFDQMEKELADLVQTEEIRTVDEYQYFLASAPVGNSREPSRSPLSELPYKPYILGYLQNNPDGSFQTPLVGDPGAVAGERKDILDRIEEANTLFNSRKLGLSRRQPVEEQDRIIADSAVPQEKGKEAFSERYLSADRKEVEKSYLGKKQQRVEEISLQQAVNVVREDSSFKRYDQEYREPAAAPDPADSSAGQPQTQGRTTSWNDLGYSGGIRDESAARSDHEPPGREGTDTAYENFQVEVAPFHSVALKDDQVYMFRRIAINNQIYRQGFVLLVEPLARYLISSHYAGQPLAQFTSIEVRRRDTGQQQVLIRAGDLQGAERFSTSRIFPAPFDFLRVNLAAGNVPASPARGSLNIAVVVLGCFMLLGLLAIYYSMRAIVVLSERRSQFVSSVTHELKTPLTNIRLYIEMLEQGIAATPEREQEYLSILNSESARLSGLINNVLELAKLEKKQRHFHVQEGCFADLLAEVQAIMAEKLRKEGFSLIIRPVDLPSFAYDREVMIQILINLIENCIKFGRQSPLKEIILTTDVVGEKVRVAVSDSGPGIPRHALKKVFDDFYRVDNKLCRSTGGTGIGLALVKKFVIALGGSVEAANNDGPGCTITILLPRIPC